MRILRKADFIKEVPASLYHPSVINIYILDEKPGTDTVFRDSATFGAKALSVIPEYRISLRERIGACSSHRGMPQMPVCRRAVPLYKVHPCTDLPA